MNLIRITLTEEDGTLLDCVVTNATVSHIMEVLGNAIEMAEDRESLEDVLAAVNALGGTNDPAP